MALVWFRFSAVVARAVQWRDSSWFSLLITSTIMLVGVMIGIETDQALSCER